ncbi:TetR/AcrR family transcriptional regulator [Rossellomorea aquimaris]|uniref:TetR/AcrR family transcriptional regulator n=1 Tax=Rossellomorea aquimaris TaxID=189382 RepID=UPI0007D0A26B|nr:TetR/AcrR family transcriptional regulator [Rossellomorea aquimaris]
MYSAFERLPEEKKQHIITVCIEEFSKTGYEKTSTDTIANAAGISKGILFHYFKNKKNLFLYMIDYCRRLLGDKIMEEVQKVKEEDFFHRIKEVVLKKQKIQLTYQTETELVTNALLHPPIGLEDDVKSLLQKNVDQYSDPFLGKMIDDSLLQNYASPEKVMNLTLIALENVTKKYLHLYQTQQLTFTEMQEKVLPEIDDYISMIKYGCLKA